VEQIDKLLLLQRKRDLLSKRQSLQHNFGLNFYRPHPKQERFHRAGAFKHRMWEAGNRSGKSTGGVAEDCSWLVGERTFYDKTDPARHLGIPQHSNKGLVICADWDKVDEIFTSNRGTEGKLWSMLPRGFVKSRRRNHSGAIELVECSNGSTLRFDTVKSFLSNPMGSESSDFDFVHVDEPCPEPMYKAAARGLIDRNGKDWFTLTPLTEPWIHDMFFPDRRSKADIIEDEEHLKWAQRSSTYDNPYLTEEAIKDYENSLTEDERQCRMLGIPLELSGLVYKEFDWETHVLANVPRGWKNYSDPPAGYTIYVAIDPHPQTPHHVLFLAVAPTGEWFLYDEIYVHCTIAELCLKIKPRLLTKIKDENQKEKEVVRRNPAIICDPAAFVSYPVLGSHGRHITMADEFADGGIFVTKATKALEQGILAVKRVLKTQNQIWVSPYLEETLFEFTHYCWDTRENRPRDERDHAMENFYRLVLEEPRWFSPDSTTFVLPELAITKPEMSLPELSFDLD